MQHDSLALPISLNMDDSQTDPNTSMSGDLLSAALCAAGLDEFFAPAANAEEVVEDHQPCTSSLSSASNQAEPILSVAGRSGFTDLRSSNTPLPGITASASTSPDLPVNAASQANSANAAATVAAASTSNPQQQLHPPTLKTARLIRIVKPDGKPLLVNLGKSVESTTVASSVAHTTSVAAIVAQSSSPAVRPAPAPIPRTDTGAIGGQRVGMPVLMPSPAAFTKQTVPGVVVPPADVRHHRPLPLPPTSSSLAARIQLQQHQQPARLPMTMNPPTPLSKPTPLLLGRSRLLPAVVSSSSSAVQSPHIVRHLAPSLPGTAAPAAPPSGPFPKRSRLVNYNPNNPNAGVGIGPPKGPLRTSSPVAASSQPRPPTMDAVKVYQRYSADHERNVRLVDSPVGSGMSLVGPMRPLTAASQSPQPHPPQPVLHPPPSLVHPPPTVTPISTREFTFVRPMTTTTTNTAAAVSAASAAAAAAAAGVVEDDVDEEELGLAETYADYVPAKLKSGLSHPDQVVETSSLSSVLPPNVHYYCSIPDEVIDTGKLSALQLEAVTYACQKTETLLPSGERAGYLIGDGPGVGKGRTIAAFIYENYTLGRKRALWFSVSSDLKFDSERDLRDIGAGRIKVYALNKFKYSKISGKENGSIKKGVIFATYASLIGESSSAKSKYRSRMKQLLQWCGKDFDGVIVFDECHRAKNLVPTGSTKPTKTGQAVLELQNALPKARVLYASATGATETRNMAYMTRLGLWGEGKPFKDFNEFIGAVEKRGVGAMEVVAMDMKLRGLYLARQLSFAGVTFRIEEVPLSEDFVKTYDDSVKLWLEARKHFLIASELVEPERGQKKAMWSQFWAAHQRFFKYLCIAAKVKECVRLTREHVKNGKCVVIGLQSTGEARTLDQLEEMGGELTDFVSTAKGVFQALVEKHFPSADDSSGRPLKKRSAERSLFWDIDPDDLFGDSKPGKGGWKRKLVAQHREKKKQAKLEKSMDEDDDDDQSQSSSSDNSDNDDDDDDNDSASGSGGSRSSDDDASNDASSGEDDDDNEDGEEDIVEDSFNPFADDAEEADPWESKILDKTAKRKKKRKKPDVPEERDEELERQLEQALQEAVENDESELASDEQKSQTIMVEKKPERPIQTSYSASDFLKSSSSYMDANFKPARFATELGLDRLQVMKAELLAAIERLGEILPPNTLDQLIDELGGPEYVAEMTGRKGRVVNKDDGGILYELRNDDCDIPLELLNIAEREKFMNGDKHIAIISEAASSGISLQSDRRAKNQRRRVHITLELPWSADKAIQQFGRTHRSNQISAPEYIFLISELAGEHRFASIVAKRLESLGALTHGDRRATESRDLSQFNLDTKYGRAALDTTLKSIVKQARPMVKPPAVYNGDFFSDMRQYLDGVGVVYRDETTGAYFIEKDTNLSKFLNRLLGLPVLAQNSVFQYFSDTLREVVEQAKRDCRYDMGIMDIGHSGELVRKVETVIFYGKFETGQLKSELHTVMVERGISWNAAMDIFKNHSKPSDGFYVSINTSIASTVILACDSRKKRVDTGEQLYHVYRPNVGLSTKSETMGELKKRFKKVTPEKAESVWKEHFDASSQMCQHEYWFGRCRTNEIGSGVSCDVGRRKRAYNILAGSVLAVWNTVEDVLSSLPGRRQSRMQVVRLRTDKGQKIVGILIPAACKKALIDRLTQESYRTSLESFE